MSDLFDAQPQLEDLIQGFKLRLSLGLVCDLEEGWFGLLKEMIDEMKHISVEITHIDTSYGELDVQFSPYEDTDVTSAYLVVQEKRLLSRRVCSQCGAYIQTFPPIPAKKVHCKPCVIKTSKEQTGTWLDSYK